MSASLTRSVPVTRPSPNISPDAMWPHTRPCRRRRDDCTDMSRRAGGISRLGQAVAQVVAHRITYGAQRKIPCCPQNSVTSAASVTTTASRARGGDRRRFRRCEPRNHAGRADRRIDGQNAGGADLEQPAEIRDGVDQRGPLPGETEHEHAGRLHPESGDCDGVILGAWRDAARLAGRLSMCDNVARGQSSAQVTASARPRPAAQAKFTWPPHRRGKRKISSPRRRKGGSTPSRPLRARRDLRPSVPGDVAVRRAAARCA